MAYGSEIQAKLGVDTSSVGTDLAGAKNVFNKWGQEVAATGGAHGESFGGKVVGGLEHKLLGARHLSGALAAALGFNIEKISESIASGITGGSAEGWKEAGKLADEASKEIRDIFRKNLSGEHLTASFEKELEQISKHIEEIESRAKSTPIDRLMGGGGVKTLNATDLAELHKAEKDQRDAAEKLAEIKRKSAEDDKKYHEELNALTAETLSLDGKVISGTLRKHEIELELQKDNLSSAEYHKLNLELIKQENTLKELGTKIADDAKEKEKKAAEEKEKAQKEELAREEKLFNLQRQKFNETRKLQEDQNKLTDRSKLTVGELANISGKKDFSLGKSSLDLSFGANEGLTDAQVEAKKQAQKIQDLEAEAEAKRLAGDVAGSENALGQAGTMRDALVNSGSTKSSEGDKFGELRKQIAEDNKEMIHTLKEISETEKKKFVSQ